LTCVLIGLGLWRWVPSLDKHTSDLNLQLAFKTEPQVDPVQPPTETIEPHANPSALPAPAQEVLLPPSGQPQPQADASPAVSMATKTSPGRVQQVAAMPRAPQANRLQTDASTRVNDSTIALPMVEPLEVTGHIKIVGSASISPLIRQFYRRFILEGYRGVMNILSVGTERGFQLFCQELQADIVLANRAIKAHESLACAAKGRSLVELTIGTDMLTVVVNRENDLVQNASLSDLQKMFTVNNWSQVNTAWPAVPIVRFIPARTTGTFDFFVDKVFDGDAEALIVAANTEWERDPESIAQSVGNEIHGIGIVAYPFYKKYAPLLNKIAIDGVEPSPALANRQHYLLTRSLRIYSDTSLIRDKPQVRAFVSFLLNHVSEEIEQAGYFPLSAEELADSKLTLLEALGIEP
jgi:phosphate transport system substrate-binding protein